MSSIAETSRISLIFSLVTSPKITRLIIHNVYAAPMTKVVPDKSAIQKLTFKLARITKTSPTNPDVPGRAALASAKKTIKPAKRGIIKATPP